MPDLPNSQLGRALELAGAPSNGTSEVQTLTLSAFGACTLTLGFKGASTSIVLAGTEDNTALPAAIVAALVGLRTIGAGGVTATSSGTTDRAVAITFAAALGKLDVDLITASVANGATVAAVATTTPGVTATARGQALTGQLLVDSTTGKWYSNTGTATAPTWTVVGSQS